MAYIAGQVSFVSAWSCPHSRLSPFPEEAVFIPSYASAPFVEYESTIAPRVYLWTVSSVPWTSVSVLLPVPECSLDRGLVIPFAVRCEDPAYFVSFLKMAAALWGRAWFPCKFFRCFFSVGNCHWCLNRERVESLNYCGSMNILMRFILPINELAVYFHQFVPFFSSFFRVV